jgi:hypothetical protein
VSEELAALVHGMLRKDPAERPDMGQVVAELERLGATRTTLGPGNGNGTTPPMKALPGAGTPRLRVIAGVVAVLFVCVAVVGGRLLLRHDGRPDPGPAPARTTMPNAEQGTAPAAAPTAGLATVRWSLRTTPEGAQVVRLSDQKVLGTTPWVREQARGEGSLQVELRRDGYFPKPVRLDLQADQSLSEVLTPKSDDKIPILN